MRSTTNVNIGKIFTRTAGTRLFKEGAINRGDKVEYLAITRKAPQKATLKCLKSGTVFETAYSSLHRSYDLSGGTYGEKVVTNTATLPSIVKRTIDILLQDRDVFEYVRNETGGGELASLKAELAEQKRKWEDLRNLLK